MREHITAAEARRHLARTLPTLARKGRAHSCGVIVRMSDADPRTLAVMTITREEIDALTVAIEQDDAGQRRVIRQEEPVPAELVAAAQTVQEALDLAPGRRPG